MSTEVRDSKNEVKKYTTVFIGLLILTAVTVAANNLKIGVTVGVIIALIIAIVKGSLVACNFMHLTSEKKVIYFVLILALIFFLVMMSLICISYFNVPEGLHYVS